MLKVKCGGRWKSEHGLGKANGHGGHYTISGVGITRVQINAGSYVDRIEFYKGSSMVKRCGSSSGGGRYSANARKFCFLKIGMKKCFWEKWKILAKNRNPKCFHKNCFFLVSRWYAFMWLKGPCWMVDG